jgi:hypothetical protein
MITEQDYQVTHEGEIYFVRLDDEGELVTVSDKDKNPADLDEDDEDLEDDDEGEKEEA